MGITDILNTKLCLTMVHVSSEKYYNVDCSINRGLSEFQKFFYRHSKSTKCIAAPTEPSTTEAGIKVSAVAESPPVGGQRRSCTVVDSGAAAASVGGGRGRARDQLHRVGGSLSRFILSEYILG